MHWGSPSVTPRTGEQHYEFNVLSALENRRNVDQTSLAGALGSPSVTPRTGEQHYEFNALSVLLLHAPLYKPP